MKPLIIIRATYEEYVEYRTKFKRTNKILSYWLDIFSCMPNSLKKEAKSKPTQLIQVTTPNNSSSEKYYKFITDNASESLTNYLQAFTVIVTEDK